MSAGTLIEGTVRAVRALRRTRFALPGAAIVLIFVLTAVFAPVIATHDPYASDLAEVLLDPSASHWFGTDELGRDLFSRIVYGARLSLLEGVVSVAIAMLFGVPLGVAAGYFGGALDAVLMRGIDILLAFPGVLLAIVIVSVLGPTLTNAMIAVGLYGVPVFARLARGAALGVTVLPYIEACRATGLGHWRILRCHVLPNIAGILLVVGVMRVAIAILTTASLSFLGLGAQPPAAEWGAMLATSRDAMLVAPHATLFPGLSIILLVLGLNLFQNGLAQIVDPRATLSRRG
jgi:ABC-type dipeptide/oligopeptide/nickel transport system permease subunit